MRAPEPKAAAATPQARQHAGRPRGAAKSRQPSGAAKSQPPAAPKPQPSRHRPPAANQAMSDAVAPARPARADPADRADRLPRRRQDHAAQPAAADPALAETAVIINEFGEIGLDHLLVEQVEDGVVLLSTGCLCCTMRGDLVDALEKLLRGLDNGRMHASAASSSRPPGLADPAPVLHTAMVHPYLVLRFRLDGVVTVVDAVNGARHARRASRGGEAGGGRGPHRADQDRSLAGTRRREGAHWSRGCARSIRRRRSSMPRPAKRRRRGCSIAGSTIRSARSPTSSAGSPRKPMRRARASPSSPLTT